MTTHFDDLSTRIAALARLLDGRTDPAHVLEDVDTLEHFRRGLASGETAR